MISSHQLPDGRRLIREFAPCRKSKGKAKKGASSSDEEDDDDADSEGGGNEEEQRKASNASGAPTDESVENHVSPKTRKNGHGNGKRRRVGSQS